MTILLKTINKMFFPAQWRNHITNQKDTRIYAWMMIYWAEEDAIIVYIPRCHE